LQLTAEGYLRDFDKYLEDELQGRHYLGHTVRLGVPIPTHVSPLDHAGIIGMHGNLGDIHRTKKSRIVGMIAVFKRDEYELQVAWLAARGVKFPEKQGFLPRKARVDQDKGARTTGNSSRRRDLWSSSERVDAMIRLLPYRVRLRARRTRPQHAARTCSRCRRD